MASNLLFSLTFRLLLSTPPLSASFAILFLFPPDYFEAIFNPVISSPYSIAIRFRLPPAISIVSLRAALVALSL